MLAPIFLLWFGLGIWSKVAVGVTVVFFIVFYGLDWVATVPPTVALCRQHFGLTKSGVVYGWVFASHMVGAGIGASFAGFIRSASGDYAIAWVTAGILCIFAALSFGLMPKQSSDG